jgi:thiol:disulfide interchange protein
MKALRVIPFILLFAGLISFTEATQAQNPVTWTARAVAQRVAPGAKVTVQATAQIEGGWHMYSITQGPGGPIPTRITLAEGQPFTVAGTISGPKPKVQMDPNFGINTETYDGSASFSIPVTVKADAPAGAQNVQVNVRFQACNDTLCLPPRTVKLSAPVEIASAIVAVQPSPAPSPLPKASPSPSQSPVAAAVNANSNVPPAEASPTNNESAITISPSPAPGKGTDRSDSVSSTSYGAVNTGAPPRDTTLWSFIWLAMGFGAVSLLTPCVFPMVPITVSYFTSHTAGHRSAAIRDALIYALGIIFTFTALGVILAVIFGAAGINKLAANPWINILITAIFLSFAMSLFGAFNLQVPSSVLTKLDALSRREEGTASGAGHIVALLLMGLTFSLTSFTCTAPFVGTLLVNAALGNWLYPVVGMLAFSSVFALPFFVLALAPQLLSQLPKAGGWLNSVKVVMGLLEVAAAMKFISNVDLIWGWGIFTREVVLASWVAVALLITIYLLGKFQLTHDTQTERIGAVRLLIALVSLSLGFYLLTGLFGARLGELESFLPPATTNARSASSAAGSDNGELPWILNDYKGALARAKEENKLVLIDFTGYTCTNCRWMEANMFPKEQVKRELDKYVRVRLYTDREGEIYEQQQRMQEEMFGTVALPFYAVVDANGKPVASFPGLTRNPSEFVAFLSSGHPGSVQTAQARLR